MSSLAAIYRGYYWPSAVLKSLRGVMNKPSILLLTLFSFLIEYKTLDEWKINNKLLLPAAKKVIGAKKFNPNQWTPLRTSGTL